MKARIAVLLGALALAACNTVAGAGADMQNAGATVTQEARQTQAGI